MTTMNLGTLQATAEVTGAAKLQAEVNKIKTAMSGAAKAAEEMIGTQDKLSKVTADATRTQQRMAQVTEQSRRSFSSLGQATREMSTNLLGANIAAVALGTAVGSLLTQGLMLAIRAIGEAAAQFSRLHNELARVPGVMHQAGEELDFLRDIAANSNIPLEQLTQQYIELSKEALTMGVSQETVRKRFEEWNETLKRSEIPTVTSSLSRLSTAFGGFLVSMDRSMGISKGFIFLLDGLAQGFNSLSGNAKDNASALAMSNAEVRRMERDIASAMAMSQQQLKILGDLNRVSRLQADYNKELAKNNDLQKEAAILAGKAMTPQMLGQRDAVMKGMRDQVNLQKQLVGLTRDEQEILTQLYTVQLALQKISPLASLTTGEELDLTKDLQDIQLRNRAVQESADQAQNAISALNGTVNGMGAAFTGNFEALRNGFAGITEEVTSVMLPATQAAMDQMEATMRRNSATEAQIFAMKRNLAKQEQEQILHTAGLASQAITALFPQSKAAAIAAAVINTAVAVTRALSGAPPPLNFINAALVAAAGAGQIMAIRNTSPTGGGSVPSVPSAPTTPPVQEEGPSGRAVTIQIQGGQLFSSQQLQELIGRISDEVKNGASLVATEIT
jgi:hypothetical protein